MRTKELCEFSLSANLRSKLTLICSVYALMKNIILRFPIISLFVFLFRASCNCDVKLDFSDETYE